ncbi:MAG: bifunctional demethylmenaquinone methyltransferase/2-methoxy-6-polyprenyl-1,4-benzoquinol methylase UbiE [Acidobacteriaceae bacterium]|nr:bifunctional demethylmenaquinone methyltransferase/2-methoxy-6-polyprenyl-1,4-benzoquinol methylase UbiE [Acidobacteriaceae bacterium]
MSATGAQPGENMTEQQAAAAVQQMFDSIAPKYDLLNHVLSAGIDRRWWRRCATTFRDTLAKPEAVVLDLCCGTGDMTSALLSLRPSPAEPMVAVDFSHEMITRGIEKHRGHNVCFVEADALTLPMPDNSFDLVVSAFGFRNLANYDAGLREIARVLKPGGQIGILDFNQPGGPIGKLYAFYFRRVLPAIGAAISRSASAYAYLPASVGRFPKPPEMLRKMEAAGYTHTTWTPYTFGIAGLYRGTRLG